MSNINVNDIKNKVEEINNKLENSNLKNGNKNINDVEKKVNAVNNKINKINDKNGEEIPNVNVPRNTHVNSKNLFNPIGILDPEGKEINPLTGETYKNLYTDVANRPGLYSDFGKVWSKFPMYQQRENILKLVHENQVLLVQSATGSGKTVLTPKFLLHSLNYQGKLIITNPKTVPTKSAAEFAAKCLDVPIGEQVGYAYKGEKKIGDNTKLFYVTDGLVLAWLQSDPLLSQYDGILVDEIHERSVQIEILLFNLKFVLKNRKDFKVILMSATIDPKQFMDYYKDFGIKQFEAKGESYQPIEEFFLDQPINKLSPSGEIVSVDYIEKTVHHVMNEILIPNKQGDILVFMPGKADCDKFCLELEMELKKEKASNEKFANKPFCVQLTSSSKKKTLRNATEKNYAVGNKNYRTWEEGHTRRIVAATNIAESSITFSGEAITYVVDTGLSKEQRFYPDTAIEALELRYIAKANHKQRRGRTGRMAPGFCYNMFTKEEYENTKLFPDYPEPPIELVDITDTVLMFMSMVDHVKLPFKYPAKKPGFNSDPSTQSLNDFLMNMITLPKENYVSESLRVLFMLDAIELTGKNTAVITPIGKAMLKLTRNTSVQMARAIIEGFNYRCAKELIDIAAVMENIEGKMDSLVERFKSKEKKNSPELKKEKAHYDKVVKSLSTPYGDFISIYNIFRNYLERAYSIRYERGREKLTSRSNGNSNGPNPGNQWAKEHFISVNKLKKALKSRKDIDRALGMIIRDVKRAERGENQVGGDDEDMENMGNMGNNVSEMEEVQEMVPRKRFLLFRNDEPTLHDKLEDNMIQALVAGYVTNIVHKVGKNYATCFPKVQTLAGIDRGSLFNNVAVKPTSCFYDTYFGIRGVKRLSIFSKIPEKVVKNMNPVKREIINECAKKVKSLPSSSNRKSSKKSSSYKSKKGRRSSSRGRSSKGRGKRGKSRRR